MVRIAIDIDGVLANSFKLYREIAEAEGVTGVFDQAYNGIFKVKTAEGDNFGNVLFGKYRDELTRNVEPMPNALEAYTKFVAHNDIVTYIVTARDNDGKNATKDWLAEHGFSGYEDLLFLKNKLKAPCNVIVDDKPKTVKDYNNNARMGIIHDAPYNREFDMSYRIDNLNEAYKLVESYL